MKYSLNFKEKLQPIARKPQTEDESSNRNSIFKRSTIKDAILRPIASSKLSAESPLVSKHSKDQ
jgi:hypothetical protein